MMPTFGSLFSGIGGFNLGLELAGWKPLWQVEIDDYRRAILEREWPNVDRHKDIQETDPGTLGQVDLICGGFPCQDLSLAGKRAGLAGERSGLWFDFLCRDDWGRVPGDLRRLIWKLYREQRGSPEHVKAVKAAIRGVM